MNTGLNLEYFQGSCDFVVAALILSAQKDQLEAARGLVRSMLACSLEASSAGTPEVVYVSGNPLY